MKSVMDKNNVLSNSLALLTAARERDIKVIHAPITFSDDYRELRGSLNFGILANVKAGGCFKASEWGGAFCDAMKPLPNEIVVNGKIGLCAFASTNLDFILRQNGKWQNERICYLMTMNPRALALPYGSAHSVIFF